MVKQAIDVARATRLDDNLFFACSPIEHIGRETANRRQDVVNALGPSRIARISEFADVFHCENPDAVVYRFIEEAGIEQGRTITLDARTTAHPPTETWARCTNASPQASCITVVYPLPMP